MTSLLTVTTEGSDSVRGSVASVRVYADAVLIDDPMLAYHRKRQGNYYTPRYRAPGTLYGMSIVGPEQSVRAIAAGCAQEKDFERPMLKFTGPGGEELRARWGSTWDPRARVLCSGVMHLVALPAFSITRDLQTDNVGTHVIIPKGNDGKPPAVEDVYRAVYRRLLLAYTTPLCPIDLPGQPEAEAEIGEDWAMALGSRLVNDDDFWRPLESHADQPYEGWKGAGLLTLAEVQLDEIVGEFVRSGQLVIPPTREDVPA